MRKSIIKTIPDTELVDTLKRNECNLCATLRELKIRHDNTYAKKYLRQLIINNNLSNKYNKSQKISYTIENIFEAVKNALCYSDICRSLGLTTHGTNIRHIKSIIKKENINISHFSRSAAMLRYPTTHYTDEEMFKIDSFISRGVIKHAIEKRKLIPYECKECNITNFYNEKPLTLTLEHKNGINNDHRLENLCFLCPNCQSQTLTFCGKNTRIKNSIIPKPIRAKISQKGIPKEYARKFNPSIDELITIIKTNNTMTNVGKYYNVSGSAIKRRCKLLNIDYKKLLKLDV